MGKELEAAKISIEQVQKINERKETLKALKSQHDSAKEMERKEHEAKLRKCKEIHALRQTTHPRFVECQKMLVATSLLEMSEFSSTGSQGTIGSKTATGAASKGAGAASGAAAKKDDEVITEDMKASEEAQAKKDAEKEKEEKEENAKLNGDDSALIKLQEEKAKMLEGT